MSITLQEQGLSPLDGQLPEAQSAVHYSEYWGGPLLDALERLGPVCNENVGRLALTSRFLKDVSTTIIQERDADTSPKECVSGITRWSQNLGNLNTMFEGKDDLIGAAGILLEYNIDPKKGVFKSPIPASPDDMYKAFTRLWTRNDLRAQRPNQTLLVAAEQVHKAAWLEENPARQNRLFHITSAMYEYLLDSGQLSAKSARSARNYLYDIQFHLLSQQLREGIHNNDTVEKNEAQLNMGILIRREAEKLKMKIDNLSKPSQQGKGSEGFVFEDLVPLSVRSAVAISGQPEFEVRHAFTHEDISIANIKPKASFDVVVQKHEQSGITATPVQLKLESDYARAHGITMGAYTQTDYLPGIVYIDCRDMTNEDLRQAAITITRGGDKNAEAPGRNIESFRRLLQVLRPLLHG